MKFVLKEGTAARLKVSASSVRNPTMYFKFNAQFPYSNLRILLILVNFELLLVIEFSLKILYNKPIYNPLNRVGSSFIPSLVDFKFLEYLFSFLSCLARLFNLIIDLIILCS